jgi:hypothetical protein
MTATVFAAFRQTPFSPLAALAPPQVSFLLSKTEKVKHSISCLSSFCLFLGIDSEPRQQRCGPTTIRCVRRPLGVYVDPDKMIAAREASVTPWQLPKRAWQGEFPPANSFDPTKLLRVWSNKCCERFRCVN